MKVQLFVAETADFDENFYKNSISNLPTYKLPFDYTGKIHRQETLLAWSIVNSFCKKEGIKFGIAVSENGKPDFVSSDYRFSISHSKGTVAVAFAAFQIGADVEKINPSQKKNIYRRVLSEAEEKAIAEKDSETELFFRLWTLKESRLKFSGEGLSGGLRNFDFSEHLYDGYFESNECFYNSFSDGVNCFSICGKEFFNTEIIKITADLLT